MIFFSFFLSKLCLSSIHQGSTPVNECRRKMIDAFLFYEKDKNVGNEDGGFRLLSSSKRGQRSNIAVATAAFSAIKVFFPSFYRILDGLWRWACFACCYHGCYQYVVTNSATVHWVPLPPQLSNRRDLHTACKYRQRRFSCFYYLLCILVISLKMHNKQH